MTQKKNKQSRETLETKEFAEKKITPLFWKYSLLALAGLIAQAISVIADGFFVGNSLGTIGLATIGIVASLWTIVIALGALFGVGGSTLIANKLGENDIEGAREAYATMTIFTFIISLILAILALLNIERLLFFMGATEEILPHAVDYTLPYFIAAPFSITGTALYYYTRAIGKPFASSVAYILPAIIATIAEYILLFKLDIGIAGSAASWIICVASAFFLLPYLQFVKGGLKLKAYDFKLNFKIIKNGLRIGVSPFLIELSAILTTIIVNRQIINYGGGELEIAAFGTVNAYIVYIITLLCNALVSGLLPIASFNYGMKSYSRLKELLKKSSVQSVAILTLLLIVIFIFVKPIVAFFAGTDVELIDPTISIIKDFLPLYALGLLALITSGYYQAIEKVTSALVSALCRIAFSTPLLFILPKFIGIKGIWYAQPTADAMAFILCVILIAREVKALGILEKQNS